MNEGHVLLCLLGESASGKDSLAHELSMRNGYKQLISYTTRPRRQNEGDTHIFSSAGEFEKMLAEKAVAAYTCIGEFKYWSTLDQIYNTDIYLIDPAGLNTLRKLNLPNLRIVSVYVNVPEEIRRDRAMGRGDDSNVYRNRVLAERAQFREMKKNMDVDYVISNIKLSKALSVLDWICSVEGLWKNKEGDHDSLH